jgi:enamine deaminase RidA (YjgF/YER057c/UK114 family)
VAKLERIAPPELHRAVGWTHVVKAASAVTVYVSGQTGRTPGGAFLPGLAAQAEQAYENLRLALAAAGAAPADVAKEVVYVVGFTPDKGAAIWPARNRLWGGVFPASTVIGVQALAHPEALIEVEAVACLG